ncbi:MAG: hypothetical protein HYV42_00625 [Candidatus Magasanikbacteria bacterium]|nr:hypothetical protein [Candidatus Magasanikbacteria bacterium]
MGWFDTIKYSTHQHYFAKEDIRKIVRQVNAHSSSVSKTEEEIVECLVAEGRHGDGKISLQQIWRLLTRLKNEHKLSETDRKVLMAAFEAYFKEKFGE